VESDWQYAISEGRSAGLARAGRYELTGSPEDVGYALNNLQELLLGLDRPVNPRFVSLLTENVTTAAVARANYRDEPLGRRLLQGYLNYSTGFFNSFTHL
jgi:hypothetical protein